MQTINVFIHSTHPPTTHTPSHLHTLPHLTPSLPTLTPPNFQVHAVLDVFHHLLGASRLVKQEPLQVQNQYDRKAGQAQPPVGIDLYTEG